MIVLCEGCQRRFQLDDARIPKTGARVRCKHCKHRFRVPPPGDAAAEATEASAPTPPPAAASANGRIASADAGETSDGFGELRFVNEPLSAAAEDAPPVVSGPGPESEPEPESVPDPAPEPEAAAAEDLAEASTEEPGGRTFGGSDAPWEFGDSSLSFEEASVPPEAAAGPVEGVPSPQPGGIETPPPAGSQPPADEPATDAPAVDPTPSLQVVAPESGVDSVLFEMTAGADPGEPLRLESEREHEADGFAAGDPDAPEAAPAESAPSAVTPPAVAPPEIGTAADWEALDAEAPPSALLEPIPRAPLRLQLAPVEATAADPDWPMEADEPAEALRPPPPARGRRWLEHASWALSLVLLLAVARGSVRVVPVPADPPSGQVEVAGLSAENVRARFVENARSGTLFVVSGELHNRGKAPVRARRLRVVLLDSAGREMAGEVAPVATALPAAMVREAPVGALSQQQEILAEALAERSLTPGQGVAFLAILGEVPDDAVRFRIEPDTGANAALAREEPRG